jgi:hypothetical protein
VDPLEDPPMSRGREREGLVGKVGGEETRQRADRQVLVDDDHDKPGRSVVQVVGPAAEQRIGVTDGSQ